MNNTIFNCSEIIGAAQNAEARLCNSFVMMKSLFPRITDPQSRAIYGGVIQTRLKNKHDSKHYKLKNYASFRYPPFGTR